MGQILTNELDKTSTNVATWHKLKMKPRNDDKQQTTTRRRRKKKNKEKEKKPKPQMPTEFNPPERKPKGLTRLKLF